MRSRAREHQVDLRREPVHDAHEEIDSLLGDQASCEEAWHITGEDFAASCYWDVDECSGCGTTNFFDGLCQNSCQ